MIDSTAILSPGGRGLHHGPIRERSGLKFSGEDNLSALRTRMKAGQYRHQPIRRVHIAKAPNQTRPIGISSVEDKIVQGALREVLEAIWRKWLDRRSQRARMNWDRFGLILDRFPLPRPTIRVQIWARAG